MRITALHVSNFKRLHDVEIRPDADRTLVLIGGRNANGKSSLLDALTTAFGGKKQQPTDPVRHGADEATIRVELDGGELEVRRAIRPDGDSVLEVRDRLGAVKAPQAMLDRLIGVRFLDPLAFLSLKAAEQAVALMRVIPGAERIAGLNEKHERAFKRRTEVGRDLKKAEAQLSGLPEVTVGTPIDTAALAAERAAFAEQQHAGAKAAAQRDAVIQRCLLAKNAIDANGMAIKRIEDEIARLQSELAERRRESTTLADELMRCDDAARAAAAEVDRLAVAWKASLARRDEVDRDLARADVHNRVVFAAESQQQRRADVAAEVKRYDKEHADLTKLLDTIDTRKAEILAAAALPVEGLAIAEQGITLGGVPFDQASDAERWRVALAIAVAASPGLSDVWIRDGALLDDESLSMVAEHAEAAGKRVWIERVGTRDPGVIEIRDGRARPGEGHR